MKSVEIFKKTKESSNRRRDIYLKYAKEPESMLLQELPSNPILSISHFYSNLNTYEAELKNKPEIFTLSNNDCNSPCPSLIAPASSGEESLCLSEDQEKINKRVLSLKEICSYLIDSNLLKIDKPLPKYINLNQLQDFVESKNYSRKPSTSNDKSRELLFMDIKETIEDEHIVYEHLKEIFNQTTGEKVKLHVSRIKLFFFKGKYSALIRFGDPETAAYLYFNFCNSYKVKTREILGNNFSVFYVLENNVKTKRNDWVAVVMRGLNQKIEREHIITRLKDKLNLIPTWIEELITIKHHKYALFGVSSIEEAETICKHFKNSNDIRDKIKANIHPRSSKIRNNVPPKFMRFLTYNKEFDSDLENDKEKIEAESIKEQLKQKVLDLKSSGKLTSSLGVSNTLPDLINAFNQEEEAKNEEKEKDEKKIKEKEPKVEDERENFNNKRTHSKIRDSKYHTNYDSKSRYYHESSRGINKEKTGKNEKNQHSGTEDNKITIRPTKNRSRSHSKSRNKSRSRLSRSFSYSRHHEFSKSRSRDKKIRRNYSKNFDNNAIKKPKEKNYKKSRSKSKKGDRSRSKTSERGRYLVKNNKNEPKSKKYSKSRSNSLDKKPYYKRKSPSYEKRYYKNDSKEKYRKKYLRNVENNKEKDIPEKEESSSKFSKGYKNSYNETYDKFNSNKNFDKTLLNHEENYKRTTTKLQKASILERINKGSHYVGNKDNKESSAKLEDSTHYRQRYGIYDEYNAFNEEKVEILDEGQTKNDKTAGKKQTGKESSSDSKTKSKY